MKRLHELDAIRGLAALGVVFFGIIAAILAQPHLARGFIRFMLLVNTL
ncbi:MAG: hypothetical protein OHK0052_11370 [Anaerolineales bacterium]